MTSIMFMYDIRHTKISQQVLLLCPFRSQFVHVTGDSSGFTYMHRGLYLISFGRPGCRLNWLLGGLVT